MATNNNNNIQNTDIVPSSNSRPLLNPNDFSKAGFAIAPEDVTLNPPVKIPQVPLSNWKNPITATVESTAKLPSIAEQIRKSAATKDMGMSILGAEMQLADELKSIGKNYNVEVTTPSVKLNSDAFTQLNNGTYIPNYDSYVQYTNNEDRSAQMQGIASRWGHGISKFIGKTLLYGVGGVVSPVAGLMEWGKTGNFNAVWNNDFTKYLDDLDVRMDHKLPNYYSDEEKNYNFLRKMGTANLWANDFLGGVAFTTGAMASEFVWSSLTGGASLAASAGRLGGRISAKLGGKLASKAYLSGIKAFQKSYLRSIQTPNRVAGTLNNLRFMATSAGWEASVEANGYLKQARQNFYESYRNRLGRNPTSEEIAQFEKEAISAGNNVFAGNMAVLAPSNIIMFGETFGIAAGLNAKLSRTAGKIFGLDVSKAVEGGKIVYNRVKPSRLQKIAATSFNVLEKPLTEGVWEEGTQGVISNAANKYIESRFNPGAAEENISFLNAIKKGFAESYGTSEGRMQIGIGALVGGVMKFRRGFGFTEYSQQGKALEARISQANEINDTFTTEQLNLLDRSLALNTQMSNMSAAVDAVDNGRVGEGLHSYDSAMFSKLETDNSFGMLDETIKDYRTFVDNQSVADIMTTYGLTEEQAEAYKQNMISSFEERVEDYKRASEIAEGIVGDTGSPVFRQAVAYNAFMGSRSYQNMADLSESISTLLGDPAISDYMKTYSSLDKEHRNLLNERGSLSQRIENIENLISTTKNSIYSDTSKDKIRSYIAETEKLEKRIEEIDSELSTIPEVDFSQSRDRLGNFTTPTVSVESLVQASQELNRIEQTINKMKKLNPQKSSTILGLVNEYHNQIVAFRSYGETLRRMSDPRFMAEEQKGLSKLLSGYTQKYQSQDPSVDEALGAEATNMANIGLQPDNVIDEMVRNGEISEDEGFTYKTYNHMFEQYQRNGTLDDTDVETRSEVISSDFMQRYDNGEVLEDELEPYLRNIANKELEGNTLSPREKRLLDDNRTTVDRIQEDNGYIARDTPLKRIERLRKEFDDITNSRSIIDINNDFIDNALSRDQSEDKPKLTSDDIERYDELYKNREDGNETQEDIQERNDIVNRIQDYGVFNGIPNLMDVIEQNARIKHGKSRETDTTYARLGDIIQEREPSPEQQREGTGQNMQNPEKVMARLVNTENGPLWEISGINIDRFLSSAGVDENMVSKDNTGATIDFGDDLKVRINYSDIHSRLTMNVEDASVFSENTNVIIRAIDNVPSNWLTVLVQRTDGTLEPIDTLSGFGSTETDFINSEATLDMDRGDNVSFEVDLEDAYNKRLYANYQKSLDYIAERQKIVDGLNNESTDRQRKLANTYLDKAKRQSQDAWNELVNNVVIKVMNNGGQFVSVVRSILPNSTSAGLSSQALYELRRRASEKFRESTENGQTGAFTMDYTSSVLFVYPGRPNFDMRLNNGDIEVLERDFTDEDADYIQDIGYIFNGNFFLNKETAPENYSSYPFTSEIIKGGISEEGRYYNKKIPVVIIKLSNGKQYAYPVRLKTTANSPVVGLMQQIEYIKEHPELIDTDSIRTLNNQSYGLGLDPAKYQIPMRGNINDILTSIDTLETELNNRQIADLDLWLTDNDSLIDILKSDATINIDLRNPFHSPKLRVSLAGLVAESQNTIVGESQDTEIEESPEPTLTESANESTSSLAGEIKSPSISNNVNIDNTIVDLPFDIKNDIDNLQNEDC